MIDRATVLAQIDEVLAEIDRLKDLPRFDTHDEIKQAGVIRLRAAIARLSSPSSEYALGAARIDGHPGNAMPYLAGILKAMRADVQAGYDRTLTELVHADVFADLLAMADELQTKGYKDAAAVIAGSVLEEHLRKLVLKATMAVTKEDGSPKKADSLNNELAAANIYNRLQQKSVTAWLDLRNKAAHGDYAAYNAAQVAALIRDVREFLLRSPA
jgi:hypothetical protein